MAIAVKPEQREAMARALCALEYKRGTAFVTTPGMSCEQYVDTRWINFVDDAEAFWQAALPWVREIAKECMEQAVHVAYQGRLPDMDAIVARVMEGQRTTQWCGEVERLRHDIERHMQSVMVAEDRAERAEVDAEIGRKWHADSSLETWFPYTAEELTRLRAELVAARADAERYRVARAKVCIVGDAFHVINLRPTYVAPDAAIEFDAAIDAAREAKP